MNKFFCKHIVPWFVYGLLITRLIVSCAPLPNTNEPKVATPADTNQSLTMEYEPLVTPSIGVGKEVAFKITNHINKAIWYPLDYGARVFKFDKTSQTWLEIEDKLEFTPLDPEKPYIVVKPDFVDGIVIYPDLVDAGEDETIRVYIFGKVYENGAPTDHEVAAYTEIVLPSAIR